MIKPCISRPKPVQGSKIRLKVSNLFQESLISQAEIKEVNKISRLRLDLGMEIAVLRTIGLKIVLLFFIFPRVSNRSFKKGFCNSRRRGQGKPKTLREGFIQRGANGILGSSRRGDFGTFGSMISFFSFYDLKHISIGRRSSEFTISML